MARLDLEALSKVFPGGRRADDVVAVRDLSLSVGEGELLVLLGPSGCGKTTTLRLIAGLERATAGDVRIAGASVSRLSPQMRDVAMVFPRGALYPHWTVYGNLAWAAQMRDRPQWAERLWRLKVGRWLKAARPVSAWLGKAAERVAQRDERVRGVARQLGIDGLLERLPSQLSDGQRQRVALGRAMMRRPSVYLMDEPLTGLDAPLRSQLRRELKEWHQRSGATVVYVTHDQTEALLLGDRVAVMNAGVLQQVGTARDVYEYPNNRFVAGFVGSPPMNLLDGKLDEGPQGHWRFRAGGWSLPLPLKEVPQTPLRGGQPLVLGIRPEDVTLGRASRRKPDVNDAMIEGMAIEIDGVVRLAESAGDLGWVHVEPASESAADAGESTGNGFDGTGLPTNGLTAKCSAAEMPRPGETVRLSLNASRLHWFDADSGTNLTLPQRG